MGDAVTLATLEAPDISRCIRKYVFEQSFSAAACVASVGGTVFHRMAYGSVVAPPPLQRTTDATLFDLGALTIPLATSLGALYLVSRGRLDLGAPLNKTIPELRDGRFAQVTLDMLLDHTAGFPSSRQFFEDIAQHDARVPKDESMMGKSDTAQWVRQQVGAMRLEYEPGTKSNYSEIGMQILGWIIESVVGKPLDVFLQREIFRPLGIDKDLFFVRLDDTRHRATLRKRVFAATQECAWREQMMRGEVSDPNAWAIGGIAGHAGLFGTMDAVWQLVHKLWASRRGDDRTFLAGTVHRFWSRSKRVRNTHWALGWDTPPVNESMAGKRFSRNTVGYAASTGCSVWVDLSSNCIGVVLTNALHPTPVGKDAVLKKFWPRVYELIAKEAESMPTTKV